MCSLDYLMNQSFLKREDLLFDWDDLNLKVFPTERLRQGKLELLMEASACMPRPLALGVNCLSLSP